MSQSDSLVTQLVAIIDVKQELLDAKAIAAPSYVQAEIVERLFSLYSTLPIDAILDELKKGDYHA